MKRKRILIVISILLLISVISGITYAFFAMDNINLNNEVISNAMSEKNNMVFDVIGGEMSLSGITAQNFQKANEGNVIAQNNTTLTINFTPNTDYNVVCNYDIVYEWTSNDTYTAHSPGAAGNEFTIKGALARNNHVYEGTSSIISNKDLSSFTFTNNSATVVSGAQIDGIGNSTSTAVWTLSSKFYNVNADQSAMAGKTYAGRFKVANVSCVTGTVTATTQQTLVDFLVNDAPRSGIDAVSSSAWVLTSDHTDELRYAGKNPDNYVEFNDELWRIIGVMPNMEYCTGTYGTATECDTTSTGSLVKIIRNRELISTNWDRKLNVGSAHSSNFSEGSNDWSDSQLMLMLNGTNYLKTGYDVNGTQLHTSYTITNNVVADSNGYNIYDATYNYLDGNGTTLYIPSDASAGRFTVTSGTVEKKIENNALNQIATVKWDLYGSKNNTRIASVYYDEERNINNSGSIYVVPGLTENRAVYWYGKIGLMYLSDYHYATNGGSTKNRAECLAGSSNKDCYDNNYLAYKSITSMEPEHYDGVYRWSLTSYSPNDTYDYQPKVLISSSVPDSVLYTFNLVVPVLYLKTDTLMTGGFGTWNNPYRIE